MNRDLEGTSREGLILIGHTNFGVTVFFLAGLEARDSANVKWRRQVINHSIQHGLYTHVLELDAISSVVIGGTLLTGGVGYVFGTMFGVLINGLIQVLIMFNGALSSWWTRIVIGLLTLVFILVQSALASWKKRKITVKPTRKNGASLTTASESLVAADTAGK